MEKRGREQRSRTAAAIGAMLLGFGLLTLLSRLFGWELRQFLPDFEAYSTFTATCFVISGLAIIAPRAQDDQAILRHHRLYGALLCLISSASAITLFSSTSLPPVLAPSSLNTSLGFFLGGMVLLVKHRSRTAMAISSLFILTLLIGAIALLGGVGLTIGFDPVFGWSEQTHMTGYTLTGLLGLSLALSMNIWRRAQKETTKPIEGLVYMAALLIVFSGFTGGIVIYTIAGTSLYHNAQRELRLIAHERAERLHAEVHQTEAFAELLAREVQKDTHPAAIKRLLRDSPSNIGLEIIAPDGSISENYGPPVARTHTAIPLHAPGLSLQLLVSNSYVLQQELSLEGGTLRIRYPMHFSEILSDTIITSGDYAIDLCNQAEAARLNCLPEEGQPGATAHRFHPDTITLPGQAPHTHSGLYNDLSDSKQIIAAITIPEFDFVVVVRRDVHTIYTPLYRDMVGALPMIMLLLIITIALISWRLSPLVRRLRHDEQRFRLLTENANDLISLHDTEGNYLYASPASQRLLGYTEEELIGHNAAEFCHPDDAVYLKLCHDTVIHNQVTPHVTCRFRRKDGRYIWLESTSSRLVPGLHHTTEIINISRDITAHREAEERLRANELRYRTLIEQASDAIMVHDRERRFIEVNQAACALLGYSRDELIGMHPEDFLLPADYTDARADVEKMRSTAQMIAAQRQLRRKNGSLAIVDIHAKEIEGDGIISIVRDISEQVRIENELRESRRQWQTLIQTAPDVIFTLSTDLRIQFSNTLWNGVSPERLHGKDPLDFIEVDDQPIARIAFERALGGEDEVDYEVRSRQPDGSTIWWYSRIGQLSNEGKVVGLLVVSRDITERKHIEQALTESERLHRSVVEVLAEGIVVQNREGVIISSNRAAQRILGHNSGTTAEYSSMGLVWGVVHEDGTPFPAEEHPAMVALATGVSQRDVIMGVMRSNGERAWISVNSEPLWDSAHTSITSVVSSFSDISAKREAEQALVESRERLIALTNHLQEVREEEKEMIAREVHDELGSIMTALKLHMTWLVERIGDSNAIFCDKLTTMSQQLDRAVTTVRRLVTQLRPTVLDDLGMWAAIEWQLREFAKYSHVHVRDNIHCQQVPMINRDKALAIYRVVQEALTNIAKHAEAKNVRLDCWDREGVLHLTLEDDGIGINDTTVLSPTSHGLRGMYERINAVGGKLEVLGTPGEGTLITIEVPHDKEGR